MYGTMFFYIDRNADQFDADHLLSIIELFSRTVGIDFQEIKLWLWDPDGNDMLINKTYKWNEKGKARFLASDIKAAVTGKYGDVATPSIIAQSMTDRFGDNPKVYLDIDLPSKNLPMKIGLELNYAYINKKMTLQTYADLIAGLLQSDYTVNNSFLYIHFRKSMRYTLESSNIPFEPPRGYINEIRMDEHFRHGSLDHVTDIFAANSVTREMLGESGIEKLKKIVGDDNVILVGDSVVFALDDLGKITGLYNLTYMGRVKKLRVFLVNESILQGFKRQFRRN